VTSSAPCNKRTERGTLLFCYRDLGYGLDLGDFFFSGFFVCDWTCGYNFFVFFVIISFFVFFFFFIIFAAPGVLA